MPRYRPSARTRAGLRRRYRPGPTLWGVQRDAHLAPFYYRQERERERGLPLGRGRYWRTDSRNSEIHRNPRVQIAGVSGYLPSIALHYLGQRRRRIRQVLRENPEWTYAQARHFVIFNFETDDEDDVL